MTAPLGASAFADLAPPANSGSNLAGASAFADLAPPASQSLFNNPVGQAAVGAGDALRNTVSSVINFARSAPSQSQMQNASNMIGGMELPKVQSYTPIAPVNNSSGTNPTAYSLGNIGGNILGYAAGGEGVGAARLAAESVPGTVGDLAQSLGGFQGRALGNAAYSASTAPDNNGEQAARGAEWSLGADAIPGIAAKIAQGAQYFMPQRYAQGIIQSLKDSVPSSKAAVPDAMGDTAKSVISDIRNSYLDQKDIASDIYAPVFNSVGNSRIYAGVTQNANKGIDPQAYKINPNLNVGDSSVVNTNSTAANSPLVEGRGNFYSSPANTEKVSGGKTTPQQTFSNVSGAYPSLPENITDNYTNKLKGIHNQFIQNPTFSNAHALQSELGVQQRYLSDNNTAPTISTANQIESLGNARDAIKSDMMGFLNKNGNPIEFDASNPGAPQTDLAQQYQIASDNFRQNVVPYQENTKIAPFALGEKTNYKPSTLAELFSAPDENMNSVLSHLPANTMDKVLYTKLGQTVPNKSAQSLLTSYENLKQQGLGSYISPDLYSKIGELNSRIKARNGLNALSTTLAGAGIGHYAGNATAGAAIGLSASHVVTPFMNYMGKRLPIDNITPSIANLLRGTYPPGRSAVLANQLNNSGVQNGS